MRLLLVLATVVSACGDPMPPVSPMGSCPLGLHLWSYQRVDTAGYTMLRMEGCAPLDSVEAYWADAARFGR